MSSTTPICALHLVRNGAQRNVQVSQVRFRRIQSRNPPEPHFDRKAMLEACQPILRRETRICDVINYVPRVHEPHPWNVLKASKLRQELEEAKMILFFHKNPISEEKDILVRNKFFKKDVFIKMYSNTVVSLATKGGFLANATPFMQSYNSLAVSPHQDIKLCLRLLKKSPQYILLAGVMDRTFLSRQQLEWLATVPSIQSLHSVTAGLLSTHQQRLYGNLNQHQQRLTMLLSQHSKGAPCPSSAVTSGGSPSTAGAMDGVEGRGARE